MFEVMLAALGLLAMLTTQGQPAPKSGSQDPPEEEDDLVGLPPGVAFAPDSEEEEPESLEDLASEEGGDEGDEEPPEPLTPEQVDALRRQLADAQAVIGRQGDELGQYRQRGQSAADGSGQQGIVPTHGQPQGDPFEAALIQAGEEFVATGDVARWVRKTNQIQNAKLVQAGQYFREEIVGETRAESDFFAKNADLLEGTPRVIYEGQLAQAKALNRRAPASEQRRLAAESTRDLLKQLGGQLVDQDKAARQEADRLRGPGARRSRTGTPGGPTSGAEAVSTLTADYKRDHQAAQRNSQSRG